MKWIYALKEKLKIAIYLASLTFIIILFNLLMKSNVSGLEDSVQSIYRDRLVAGSTISEIIEITYENHLGLEEHIHTSNFELYNKLEKKIKRNNIQADSLLNKYKKTELVEEEKKALKLFVEKNLAYKKFQNELLYLSRNSEKKAVYDQYLQQGNTLFQQVLAPAHKLSSIQTSVGEDIYKASQNTVRNAEVISTLEAGLVIIILTGIHGLVWVSNSIVNKPQKYWLN